MIYAALVGGCATAEPPPPRETTPPSVQLVVRDLQLPSGLRILVQEDHAAPLVAVVGVGSASDPPGKEGLAHLFEHLTYRARHDAGATLWSALEAAGVGEFNAETRSEATLYYMAATPAALPEMLRLEAARLASPLAGVDDEALATERDIVRNEWREHGETDFSGTVIGWLYAAVFPPSHPYARAATHESLSRVELADAEKLAKLSYRPDNMTVMVIGDVTISQVVELLRGALPAKLVGDAASPSVVGRRLALDAPDPPAPPPQRLQRYDGPVDQPELWIGWSLPGGYRDESVLEELVVELASLGLPRASFWDRDIAPSTSSCCPACAPACWSAASGFARAATRKRLQRRSSMTCTRRGSSRLPCCGRWSG
jgi:zinc protease